MATASPSVSAALFGVSFLWVYTKKIVHVYANLRAQNASPHHDHTLTTGDCTIVIPTIDTSRPEFVDTVHHALQTNPGKIFIVTVGQKNIEMANTLC